MKRQANALTAVLENWQDVENAIDIYANSAGSALRENEIYLDSWEAKSKAVSAAWNELVNSLLDSNWIKGFLDGAQNVLSWLTNTNALIPVLAGLIGGVLTLAIQGLVKWIQGLKVALTEVNLLAGGIPLLIGLITTLAVGVVTWGINASDTAKQIENLTTKIEEQQKAIDDLNAKEKEATGLYKEYASLMSKSNAYGLSTEEKENLLKISNDLVDTYGLEVEGIDAVTGAYIIGANAINDYVEALRKERNIKLEEQTDTRNKRIKKNIKKAKSLQQTSGTYESDIKNYEEYNSKFEDIIKEYQDVDQSKMSGSEKSSLYQVLSQDLQNRAKSLGIGQDIANSVFRYLINPDMSSERSTLAKTSVELNGVVNSIARDLLDNIKVDNADILDSSGESLLTQLLTPYLTTIDWKNFKQDEFETKVKEFATQAASGLSEVATKLQASQKKITSGEMNLSGYEDMYSTLQNKAGLLKQMLDQGIIDQKSYEEQVSQIYSQVANNIGLSMVEIAGKISETDKRSQQNFKNVADSFVALENQFRQGKISSVEYLTSITETIENMDFTKTFGENTEAAQQFFSTLANKSANILQDTITQFESGKMSVKDYGDNLKNFAKQQKELAKNAIEEAKALGMSEDAVKELTDEYDKNGKAIDDAVKKWEELDGINAYLDDNIETLRTATNVASEAYQSFATGLYNEFTKLSDNMQSQIIADMQKMEGLGHITAENLKAEMAKSTSASAGLASAVASNTNDVFKNLANNGGKVLTALGNAIKNFKYTITFNPNAKFSGGEFNLIKWAKTGGQEGIKLPSISWDITGKAGGGAEGLGEALSGLGQSLSVASDFLDISDYGGGSGGNGDGNGGGGSGGGSKGSSSSSTKNSALDNYLKDAENRYKIHQDETKYINDLNYALQTLVKTKDEELDVTEKINEAYRDLADNRIKDLEHQIDLQKELHGEDYDATAEWSEIQRVAHEEADRYREFARKELGYHDEGTTDAQKAEIDAMIEKTDEIQALQKTWWDAENNKLDFYSNQHENIIRDIEHARDMALEANPFTDTTSYYKQMQDAYHKEAERLRALDPEKYKEEIQALSLAWWDAQNAIADWSYTNSQNWIALRNTYNDWDKYGDNEAKAWKRVLDRFKKEFPDELDKIREIEENYYNAIKDEVNEILDLNKSRIESQKTLLQSYYDVSNSVAEAQHEINKEFAASLTMSEYLDEKTKDLLFNQKDYNILSDKLVDIQAEADKLQRKYNQDILSATADNLDEITSKYQMQYDLMMKQYEIAKAELEVAKKRQQLDNVLNERNVRMFINGQWQWVANTQDVIDAQNELADAKFEAQQALVHKEQTESMNELTSATDKFTTIMNKIDSGAIDLRDGIGDITSSLNRVATETVPALRDVINNTKSALQSFSSGAYSGSSSTGSSGSSYSSGRVLQVGSDGNAPAGATIGDIIQTAGGNYKVVAAGTSGATYNPASGLYSIKVGTVSSGSSSGSSSSSNRSAISANKSGINISTVYIKQKKAKGTGYTQSGSMLAGENGEEIYIDSNGHLIPVVQPTIFKDIEAGGKVFNAMQMRNLDALWSLSNIGFNPNNIPSMVDRVQAVSSNDNSTHYHGDIIIQNPADFNDFTQKLTKAIKMRAPITKNMPR